MEPMEGSMRVEGENLIISAPEDDPLFMRRGWKLEAIVSGMPSEEIDQYVWDRWHKMMGIE